jgi:hypothetical protein
MLPRIERQGTVTYIVRKHPCTDVSDEYTVVSDGRIASGYVDDDDGRWIHKWDEIDMSTFDVTNGGVDGSD